MCHNGPHGAWSRFRGGKSQSQGNVGCLMNGNEFWLCLHHLAEAYRAEGLTPDERGQRIVAQLERMPSVARREVLSDMALVAYNLADLYVAATAQVHRLETAASDSAAAARSQGA